MSISDVLSTSILKKSIGTVLEKILDFFRVDLHFARELVPVFVAERSFLEESLLHAKFATGSLEHLLFVSFGSDESVYTHFELLTNTMGSRYCLQVILRVPVWIKDNDYSSFSQIDTETTSTGCEKKYSKFIIFIKTGYRNATVTTLDTSCEQLKSDLFDLEISLNDIDHAFELWENQHLMAFTLVFLYKLI